MGFRAFGVRGFEGPRGLRAFEGIGVSRSFQGSRRDCGILLGCN